MLLGKSERALLELELLIQTARGAYGPDAVVEKKGTLPKGKDQDLEEEDGLPTILGRGAERAKKGREVLVAVLVDIPSFIS